MSTTHFGFESVDERDKARRVRGVFDSVAPRYDLMNDLMSAGLHRLWKAFTVRQADVRPGMRVLDIAGGTGDLARAFAERAGESGLVVLSDINEAMLVALNNTFAAADAAGEQGVANFIAERIDAHQKISWMLKSSLA